MVRMIGLAQPAPGTARTATLAPPQEVGWGPGEAVTYEVSLLGISGGRAAIAVGQVGRRRGRRTLKIRALGETVPGMILRLREEQVSLLDLAGLAPLETTSDRQSGETSRKLHTEHGATTRQTVRREGRAVVRTRRLPAGYLDPLTTLFYLRAADLRPGWRETLVVLAGTALWRIELAHAGTERLYSRVGPKNCVRLAGRAIRINDDGRPRPGARPRSVSLWISDDDARLPVQLVGETDVGQARATLTSVQRSPRALRVQLPQSSGPPRARKAASERPGAPILD